jgi:hypothetical protein
MVTFLASPKGWAGLALCQQETAVRNWLSFGQGVEVILYGDAPGTREACARLGVCHVPDVAATPEGVPLFGAIAAHAAEHARHDRQVYLNGDILLRREILAVWDRVPWPRALLIGQRIDLAEGEAAMPDAPQNREWLHARAEAGHLALHPPGGSDYFGFPRGLWQGLPDVVIGRGGYDNALVAFCLTRRIPVVDCSLAVLALHQFHDYGHLQGGVQEVFEGADARSNLNASGGFRGLSLEDASWYLDERGLHRNWARGDYLRFLATQVAVVYGFPRIGKLVIRIRALAKRLHLLRTREVNLPQVLPGNHPR